MAGLASHFEFGGVLIQPDLNTVVREGEVTKVSPRVMDVLVYLVEHRDRVVPADELLETFWEGRIVEESTVHRLISQIRGALGDSASEQRFIKTVSKRGYQAVASVDTAHVVPHSVADPVELPEITREQGDPYVFVCYSHRDTSRVYPEIEWLSAQGIKIWYDRGISAGANWRSSIGDALLGASHILYYVSANSLGSNHCNNEINLAIDEGLTIIPVYLEEIELTPDLKVGLNRIQALFYAKPTYRADLLSGLGQEPPETEVASGQPIAAAKHPARIGRFAAICAAVILLAAGGFYLSSNTPEPDSVDSQGGHEHLYSIAVLPFINLSTDEELGFFGQGLADVMLDWLARSEYLRVAARTSTFRLAEQDLDIKALADELDVFYVVEGSIQGRGDEVRITAQLIRAVDGYHVWSKTYDRERLDLLEIQKEVGKNAAAIAEEKIYIDAPREYPELFARYRDVDPRAVKYFIDAQEQSVNLNLGEGGDLIYARQLVESALAIDPDFSNAHSDLAWHYMRRTDPSIPVELASQRAHAAIREAKRLNPDDEEADFMLLQVYFTLDLNYAEAERLILEEMKAYPEGPWYPVMLMGIAAREGRVDDAWRYLATAVARGIHRAGEPAVPVILTRASLMISRGELQSALEVTGEGLELIDQGLPRAEILLMRARALIQLGRQREAEAAVAEAWRLAGTEAPIKFAPLYQLLGEDARARQILAGVTPQNRNRGDFVETYLGWGELDEAFEMMRAAVEDRDESVITRLRMPGLYDPLREDPRFQALLERLESKETPTARFAAMRDAAG